MSAIQIDRYHFVYLIYSQFEGKAVTLLDACYRNRRSLTCRFIAVPVPAWGCNNCLKLAAASEAVSFIAHVSCQRWLDDEWNDLRNQNIEQVRLYYQQLILTLYFMMSPIQVY